MFNVAFFLTLYAGFTHAFEMDHLLAVSNIVTKRNKTFKAINDGMYWGLGHTSTILLVGILFLLLKFEISPSIFKYFEAAVGFMLVFLGLFRIYEWQKKEKNMSHTHCANKNNKEHAYMPAFLIGLVHGLAGSGALILIVIGQSQSMVNGLLYLLLFGLGSVAGMMLAAGTFSLSFSKKIFSNNFLQTCLIFISALLCIGYGVIVIKENLM